MFDKLKGFFNGEINLPQLKKIVDLKEVDLSVLSNGNNSPLINVDKSTVDKSVHLTLNVQSNEVANPELLAARVGELLAEHREEENKPSFEIEAGERIHLIESDTYYKKEADFFKDKVPESDKSIVSVAYYIRGLSDEGKSVKDLVKDIRTNQGTRGANIVNLVGRGYFESYLKPMYLMLADNPNFELRMFIENYELIVNNAPFAYFVNSTQSVEDLADGLVEKITFSRQYGQHKLAIHAIGSANISKVNDAIKDQDLQLLVEENIDTEIQRNVLTMTIYYKD